MWTFDKGNCFSVEVKIVAALTDESTFGRSITGMLRYLELDDIIQGLPKNGGKSWEGWLGTWIHVEWAEVVMGRLCPAQHFPNPIPSLLSCVRMINPTSYCLILRSTSVTGLDNITIILIVVWFSSFGACGFVFRIEVKRVGVGERQSERSPQKTQLILFSPNTVHLGKKQKDPRVVTR